jgi:hypothetical protein
MDFEKLKAIGMAFKSSSTIERAYETLKGIPMLPIAGDKLLVLDLDSLPTKPLPFKEVFLRWALTANEGRMLNGDDPIFPYALVKTCPLWKVIPMPIKTLKLTKEGLFNKPSIKTASAQPKVSSINRAR